MWPNTISSRLVMAFMVLTVAVSSMYGLLVYNAMKYTEDDILDRRVLMESDFFIREYIESSGEARLPRSNAIQSYLSSSPDLPLWLKNEPLGSRELHDREVHIAVTKIPGTSETLYIVLDELQTSSLEGDIPALLWVLVLVGITITSAGLAVAVLMGKHISAPLRNLTSDVERFDGDFEGDIDLAFHGAARQDEVGALSRAFTGLIHRLSGFINREQKFTQYASHELSTPITIVLNSVAVLRLPGTDSERNKRSLGRIENAAHEMEGLITTFLYLGRENSKQVIGDVSLSQVLEQGLDKHEEINEGHLLKVEKDIESGVVIQNDEKLVSILIDNVLRNVFSHGNSTVSISLNSQRLEIVNDFEPSMTSEIANRKPYGLEIIERIAEQCGLKIDYGVSEKLFTFTISL